MYSCISIKLSLVYVKVAICVHTTRFFNTLTNANTMLSIKLTRPMSDLRMTLMILYVSECMVISKEQR